MMTVIGTGGSPRQACRQVATEAFDLVATGS
jgi:hypothetical protein